MNAHISVCVGCSASVCALKAFSQRIRRCYLYRIIHIIDIDNFLTQLNRYSPWWSYIWRTLLLLLYRKWRSHKIQLFLKHSVHACRHQAMEKHSVVKLAHQLLLSRQVVIVAFVSECQERGTIATHHWWSIEETCQGLLLLELYVHLFINLNKKISI